MSVKYELYKFKVGEILTLKKSHPCGDCIWIVERVGQDIGIKCRKCGHFVIISRRTLEKSVKKIEQPAMGAVPANDDHKGDSQSERE
ncbi:MAG: DUF951 domain-containing protein [Saccharofermentanales bacterium]